MKKSKIIFGIIAAVVVVAVILVIALNSGSNAQDETSGVPGTSGPSLDNDRFDNNEPAGTTGSNNNGSNGIIGGNDATTGSFPEDTMWDLLHKYFPSMYPDKPSESETPENKYSYVSELTYKDLPASNGCYYKNDRVISKSVVLDNARDKALNREICFGVDVDSTDNYLALNPVISHNGSPSETCSFAFEPSAGYVVTIPSYSDCGYGTYIGCNTTFVRALDYSLPSGYLSASTPGTIWYLDKDTLTGTTHCAYIDVRVYLNEMMCGVFRIYISKDADGLFYMDDVMDLNQLHESTDDISVCRRLSVEQAEELYEMTLDMICENEMLSELLQINNGNRKYHPSSDFIVDYREKGMSSYFSYVSLDVPEEGGPESDAKDAIIIAVTLKTSNTYINYKTYAPTTFYYFVQEGFGVNGEDVIKYCAMDFSMLYHLKYLDLAGYPGYSTEPSKGYGT